MLWWTLRQLKSEDWKEREEAAKKLGASKDLSAVEPLVDGLKDRNAHVRHAIEHALVNIGEPAVQPLMTVLRDRNPDLRRAAESVLVKMGGTAVGALGSTLYDKNIEVREAAAAVLSRIKDPTAINQLLAVVKRGNSEAKQAAASGLVRAGHHAVEPLAATLKENVPGVRETAAAALVRIGSKATDSLIAALKDGDIRESVIEALEKIDPKWPKSSAALLAVAPLIASLKDKNERLRKSAATVLGQMHDPRIFEPLAACVLDEDEGVQEAVATALGNLGDHRAVVPLVAALKHGTPKGRRAAAAALVTLGTNVVAPLVEALKDRDNTVREAAATVLVRVGHAAVEPLVDALWKIDPEWAKCDTTKEAASQFVAAVKDNAGNVTTPTGTSAPGKAGPARVVKPLVAMLKAKEAIVRKEMLPMMHMGDLADVQAISATLEDSDPDVRAAATKRLLQIASGLNEPLQSALKHDLHMVRRAAAHALAKAGDARGRDVLRSDLLDASDIVVLDAAESLLSIGDVVVVEPLLKLLKKIDDALPSTTESCPHNKERVLRLLGRVVERYPKEIAIDDLRTIARLHEPEHRFVASVESAVRVSATDPISSTVSAHAPGQLSELARQELSRRSLGR